MRNEAFLIAGAAAALMATACDKASNITGPEVAYAKPAFNLAAGSHTVTQDDPWLIATENPCNGEQVIGNVVFGSSVDNSGGSSDPLSGGFHVSISFSSHGSGTGAPSLLAYKINDQTNESDQDPEGPQATEVFEEQLLVNAAKSELNYIRHTLFKITFNAEGIPTAFFDNSFTKCAGQPIDVTI
ncbi:MAG: hypothetical protein DMD30_12660 [Gemmatimonadetes bacterium]|nr:MAG: hypothetical protein DMD30_12660 [Gemmatimonadota bacterium]